METPELIGNTRWRLRCREKERTNHKGGSIRPCFQVFFVYYYYYYYGVLLLLLLLLYYLLYYLLLVQVWGTPIGPRVQYTRCAPAFASLSLFWPFFAFSFSLFFFLSLCFL